jgi:hypothetical protein
VLFWVFVFTICAFQDDEEKNTAGTASTAAEEPTTSDFITTVSSQAVPVSDRRKLRRVGSATDDPSIGVRGLDKVGMF